MLKLTLASTSNQKSRKTGKITRKFSGTSSPRNIKNPGLLFEEYQVEKSPQVGSRPDLSRKPQTPGGERGEQWRLMVNLLTRHGIENEQIFKAQTVLRSSLRSPNPDQKGLPFYDEISQILRTRYKAENLSGAVPATRIQAKTK